MGGLLSLLRGGGRSFKPPRPKCLKSKRLGAKISKKIQCVFKKNTAPPLLVLPTRASKVRDSGVHQPVTPWGGASTNHTFLVHVKPMKPDLGIHSSVEAHLNNEHGVARDHSRTCGQTIRHGSYTCATRQHPAVHAKHTAGRKMQTRILFDRKISHRHGSRVNVDQSAAPHLW